MVIVTAIAGIISGLFGPIMKWAQRKQDLAAEVAGYQSKLDIESMKNKGVAEKYESLSAMERLKSTGTAFKYVMVGLWFYPWVMVQFSQVQATKIFANMAVLPSFYSESCVMIMFAVLGIPVGAKMATSVFNSVTGYYEGKRDQIYNAEIAIAKIDRKKVMDSLRVSMGKLDQRTVDIVNLAINAGDNDPSNDGKTS